MRMVSGAILILAASVLYSARWLGDVMHNSVVAGSPEAGYLALVSGVLCLSGLGVLVVGAITDHKTRRG
jgi:hypothetical protein